MWPLLENIGQLPRVSREAYGIDLTLTLKLKYLVLIWIYWHKNNRATSRHLSYLASPPQFESDSNVHQKNHRFHLGFHLGCHSPQSLCSSKESSLPPWLPPWLPQSTISAGTAQDHYIRTKHVKYFFTLRQNVSKTCILALIYG